MTRIRKKRKRRKSSRAKSGNYTSIKTGLTFRYRSSWEAAYMLWLDNSSDVSLWNYESIKIPYISNLKTKKIRNYFPDFHVTTKSQGELIVEIKPSRRVTQPKVVKKTRAAREWCENNFMKFVILTEIELKSLGLL